MSDEMTKTVNQSLLTALESFVNDPVGSDYQRAYAQALVDLFDNTELPNDQHKLLKLAVALVKDQINTFEKEKANARRIVDDAHRSTLYITVGEGGVGGRYEPTKEDYEEVERLMKSADFDSVGRKVVTQPSKNSPSWVSLVSLLFSFAAVGIAIATMRK